MRLQNAMASARESVRVFISSTFRDMHAERDDLVTVVFPECASASSSCSWSSSTSTCAGAPRRRASAGTANSWQDFREWIDRIGHFSVCILGQRYGWMPEPSHFRDTTIQRMQPGVVAHERY